MGGAFGFAMAVPMGCSSDAPSLSGAPDAAGPTQDASADAGDAAPVTSPPPLTSGEQIAMRALRQRRFVQDSMVQGVNNDFGFVPDPMFGSIESVFDCGHNYASSLLS